MGNSTERVQLKDLKDAVYYKQIKEFTDAEFATSKDLKKEISAGRLIQLEKTEAPRGSDSAVPTQIGGSGAPVSLCDIRALLREVLPTDNGIDVKAVAQAMGPQIAEIIRQEMAKIPVQQIISTASQTSTSFDPKSSFQEPTYIPSVSSAGMVSSIEAKKSEASSDSANDALKALRKLNKIK